MHQQQALHQRIDLDAMMDEMYRWCDMLKPIRTKKSTGDDEIATPSLCLIKEEYR